MWLGQVCLGRGPLHGDLSSGAVSSMRFSRCHGMFWNHQVTGWLVWIHLEHLLRFSGAWELCVCVLAYTSVLLVCSLWCVSLIFSSYPVGHIVTCWLKDISVVGFGEGCLGHTTISEEILISSNSPPLAAFLSASDFQRNYVKKFWHDLRNWWRWVKIFLLIFQDLCGFRVRKDVEVWNLRKKAPCFITKRKAHSA